VKVWNFKLKQSRE